MPWLLVVPVPCAVGGVLARLFRRNRVKKTNECMFVCMYVSKHVCMYACVCWTNQGKKHNLDRVEICDIIIIIIIIIMT
jgi:hypothetical protein